MKNYDHKKIEKKWQKDWEEKKLYKVENEVKGKQNYFTLVEFTYPSGNLHVGHWYAFAVPDIFARYKRMQGFNVLYPMGFDAFGLPAENAAIKLKKDPKILTYTQMDTMRTQLRSMGAVFDWDREIVSCDPVYYKWTQWMFNQFFKNDLAYRATTKVNWCPKDKTVLANEQVIDGKCERCGEEVQQRDQEQWLLRITKYADRLIDDLDLLKWPEEIKSAQKNWIGRSEGSELTFKLKIKNKEKEEVKVFTTRADTLFGVTYVVIAPEHILIDALLDEVENKDEVKKYIDNTKKKSELDRKQSKEKTGVELKGIKAINPANGEEVPVWIADYVLFGYGTGVVMAVPAHDERDWEFATKYNLPIKNTIVPIFKTTTGPDALHTNEPLVKRDTIIAIVKHWSEGKYIYLLWKTQNWKTFVVGGTDGEEPDVAGAREIREETGYQNIKFIRTLGQAHAQFYAPHKKQNRWANVVGAYFELIDGEKKELEEVEKNLHEVVWITKKEVEDNLDKGESILFWNELMGKGNINTEDGILINSGKFSDMESQEAREKITEFVGGKIMKTYRLRDWGISRQRYWGTPIPIVYDPDGKAHAIPDEHLPWLLPTDVDHTPDGTAPLERSKELFERTEKIFGKGWKPEVETMDTFVDSSWYFYRYLDSKNDKTFAEEKYRNDWMPIDLYMGGAEHTTMHLLYSRFWVKAMHDLGLVKEEEAYTIRRNRGLILGPDGHKMSKSKGNVINPDEIVERLGADTVRLYLSFMGPYGVTTNYPWDPNGVVGVRRFLERVWKLQTRVTWQDEQNLRVLPSLRGLRHDSDSAHPASLETLLHKTIKKITEDIEEYKFNTSISAMMILLNEFEKMDSVSLQDYKIFIKLLAPFAPHITEELWNLLGEKESIHTTAWPKWDKDKIIDEKIKIVIQVNGKVRSDILVDNGTSEDNIKNAALTDNAIIPWVKEKTIKRIVYVKDRLVNIVV